MSLQLHDLLLHLVNYDDSTFRFVVNKTFVSSGTLMLAVCVAYLLGIIGLQRVMSKREGFNIQYIVGIHNGFLSLISFVLMALIADNVFPKIQNNGLHWAICSESAVIGSLEFYCYLNYLVKYYEFLDTVFLVLKKKDIPFLHIYHHTMTLILTHVQLEGRAAVQWVPIVINLFVHVLMYFYYMLATFGVNVWWKKYLTSLQIIQFVIDLIFCFYAAINGIILTQIGCAGDAWLAFVGITLLSSYLLMFIDFFANTYHPAEKSKHATENLTISEEKSKNGIGKAKTDPKEKAPLPEAPEGKSGNRTEGKSKKQKKK